MADGNYQHVDLRPQQVAEEELEAFGAPEVFWEPLNVGNPEDPWNIKFRNGDSPLPPYPGAHPVILRAYSGIDNFHNPVEIRTIAWRRYIMVADAALLIPDFPAEEPQVQPVVIPLWWILENHPGIDIQRIGYMLASGYTYTYEECQANGFIIQYAGEDEMRRQKEIPQN